MKVGRYEIAKGERVTADVVWKDGRRTTTSGTLITVADDKAYIDTALGAVEVDAETVEPEGA